MANIEIEIDGNIIKTDTKESIISVADRKGIEIPRFCYHKKLSIVANCRMCLVDIEGTSKPQPACSTMASAGMKIKTNNKKAEDSQKAVMEFLLINHPLDCPICDQGGECELQDVAMQYGSDVSKFNEGKRIVTDKNIGALIQTDMTRCIHCTRCVRFGSEVAGITEMGATGRGEHIKIEPFLENGIQSELSGNMIDVCPVGALTSKPFRYEVRSWQINSKENIARHDLVGSNIFTQTHKDKIKRVVANENDSINETWISDRDRFSYEGLKSKNRILKPQIKINNNWKECEWEEALELAANKIKNNISDLGVLASNTATLEELYLLQKIAQQLGCDNIDTRVNIADPKDEIDYISNISLLELENIDYALIIGSYLRLEQPMINHRIRKATLKGAKVGVINIKEFDFNYHIENSILCSPQDTLLELAGILKAILKKSVKKIPDYLKNNKITNKQKIFVDYLFKKKKLVLILGEHINSNPFATEIIQLTQKIAKFLGAKIINATINSNAMAANKIGFIPKNNALNAQKMLTSNLNSFILFDLYPQFDFINPKLAVDKFINKDCFVLSFNSFKDKTIMDIADIILPIASFYETSGTHINIENISQTYSASVKALGDAKPGWKILKVLADLLKLQGFEYIDSSKITDEAMLVSHKYQITDNLTDIKAKKTSDISIVWQHNPYTIDALTRNAYSLQETEIAKINEAVVSKNTAKKLGLAKGDMYQGVPVNIRDNIANDCVFVHTNKTREI